MSSGRKTGLGKGLGALIREEDAAIQALPVGSLQPNRFQPRSRFDEVGLEELAESIRQQGVVQPIVVAAEADGRYTIIAGERRWRAARKAGLAAVPVTVRKLSGDRELLELALVENLQRSDLDPLEEADAYQMLHEQFQLSHEEIALRVGKGRTAITNALRLLKLPPEVQEMLRDGRLTPGQARPLLALPAAEQQVSLARRAAEEGMTARELERRASRAPAARRPAPPAEVHAAAAAEKLTHRLQAKVEIQRRHRGGVLRIHFHSEEELMRLYDLLMKRGEET